MAAVIQHNYPHNVECLELPYHKKITQLLTQFKPADLHSVLQGLLAVDAGKNWRKLKLKKLKSIRALRPEFAKACVEFCNAKAELDTSSSVPVDITINSNNGEKVTS